MVERGDALVATLGGPLGGAVPTPPPPAPAGRTAPSVRRRDAAPVGVLDRGFCKAQHNKRAARDEVCKEGKRGGRVSMKPFGARLATWADRARCPHWVPRPSTLPRCGFALSLCGYL